MSELQNEVSQGARDPDAIRPLLIEDGPSFHCELSDRECEPSLQELANVEMLLAEPIIRTKRALLS